ncbi:MAG: trigger factor [Chloroflexi bacterium]|jgi:trigger factor|nr:MAG: trigger factor [Chloroflexota bacterium]
MKITREDLQNREVALTIAVTSEDVEPYLERAYKRVVGRINVPGFRKGKAPRAVVEQFVGKKTLEDDALDIMLPEVVIKAIQQEDLKQGSLPQVQVIQREPITIKATVPLIPEVTLTAYREIRIPVEPVVVTDDQIDHLLQHLREEIAPWEPVQRKVSLGDQVILDLTARLDGSEVANQKEIPYIVAEENMSPVPGFAVELVGLNSEEKKEFTIKLPDDHQDENLASKEVAFTVTISEIKAKNLPELDDEFAKSIGQGYDTLADLTKQLKDDIFSREKRSSELQYENAIIDKLIETSSFEMSPLILDHEVEHMLEEQQQNLRNQKIGMEQYLEQIGKTPEDHREELKTAAEDRIKRSHAIGKVAELEGVIVTPEDITLEIETILSEAGDQADRIKGNLESEEGNQSIERVLTRRKTLEQLVRIANGDHKSA